MKKVIGMLALVALVGNIANAELLKNFKYDGMVEVNAYNTNNQDFNKKLNDKSGFVDTRVMVNAMFDLNDDVNAVVTAVKNNRQYGKASESATSNALRTNGVLDNVFFEQAYLNLKGVVGIDHKIGRQFYGNAGDMVIYYGPLMWPYTSPMAVNAIDGWTGWYKTGKWDFNAIIAKQAQGVVAGKNDINLSGFNAKTSVADVNLNGYVYQKNDNSTVPGSNDYLSLVGIRANYAIPQVKNLNVAGEYDMNMGKNTGLANNNKHQGFAYKVNADYSMNLAGNIGFAAEYVFNSGDKKMAATNKKDEAFHAINGDYRPGIIMGGGFSTIATVDADGVVTYNVGANWTPEKLNKLNIAAKYYDFSAANNKNTFLNKKKHIGAETDVVATWTHSDSVNVKGYFAMLQPEKKNVVKDDAETMMGAAFCVKF